MTPSEAAAQALALGRQLHAAFLACDTDHEFTVTFPPNLSWTGPIRRDSFGGFECGGRRFALADGRAFGGVLSIVRA